VLVLPAPAIIAHRRSLLPSFSTPSPAPFNPNDGQRLFTNAIHKGKTTTNISWLLFKQKKER
jgi:hypothetical protein